MPANISFVATALLQRSTPMPGRPSLRGTGRSNISLIATHSPATAAGRVTHLPELLARIFAADPFQNLRTPGVLVDKTGHVVDNGVYDYIESFIHAVVGGHFGGRNGFRHGDEQCAGVCRNGGDAKG